MKQGDIRRIALIACLVNLATAGWVFAIDPNPLENAYWRFEGGTDGTIVPLGDNTVLDSINANHLQRWTAPEPDPDVAAPTYVTDVPAAMIPQTGESNTLALRFTRNASGGGGDDLFTSVKNIENPIIDNGFTLEASFKLTFVGGGPENFQGIVCKEGAVLNGLPRLALKIRGDDGTLHIEMFDGAGNLRGIRSLVSLIPDQWYHAAVVNDITSVSLYLKTGTGSYVLQGTDTLSGGALFTDGGTSTAWSVGRAQYFDQPADWTDGIIDEVRLTNHVLVPEEFLFAEGFAPGDLDRDNDVDMDDEVLLISCGTGPDVPYDPQNPPAGCTLTAGDDNLLSADLDEDGDIDSTDFGLIQAFRGS